MPIIARDSVTLAAITSLANTRQYYWLRGSTEGAPPASTLTTNPPTGSWSTTEPGYSAGSTSSLYTVHLNVFSDGTFDYLPIQKSSSYEAAKQAWNKAQAAETAAGTASSTATTALTSANGRNQRVAGTTDPPSGTINALTGLPWRNGDTWVKWNNNTNRHVIGQWTREGSIWRAEAIESAFIANLDLNKLSVIGSARMTQAVVDKIVGDVAYFDAFVGKTFTGGTFTGTLFQGVQVTTGNAGSFPRIDMKDDLWANFIGMRFHANNASIGAEVKTNTATFDGITPGGLFLTSQPNSSGSSTEIQLGSTKLELFINDNNTKTSRIEIEPTAVRMFRVADRVFSSDTSNGTLVSYSTSNFQATSTALHMSRAGNNVFTASTGGTAVRFGTSEMLLSNAFNVTNVASFNLNTSTNARIQAWTSGGITYYSDGHTFNLVGLASTTSSWSMTPTTANNAVRNVLRYNGGRTYMPSTTLAANLHMDGNGRIFATSSSRESKVDIRDLQDPLRVLNVPVRDWYDRDEVEGYASFLDGNEDEEVVPTPFCRIPGVVAEEVEEAGLSEFVSYGLDGKPDGVLYDRLALLLIPIVRDLRTRLEALEALRG